MATVSYIKHKRPNSPGALRGVLQYVAQDYKTLFKGAKLVSGLGGCEPDCAFHEMMAVKNGSNSLGGRYFYHIVQSFHPSEDVAPKQAHEMALKLAGYFEGHQVIIATHVDAEHIHTHFVWNSTSNEGKKWHSDNHELERLRALSDKLCLEHQLSVLPHYVANAPGAKLGQREYRAAAKGESWKFTLIRAIDDALLRSRNKEEFLQNMEYEGISVKWTDTRKNITYTMPDGKKCCDDKLHDPQYLKENLERLFLQRKEHGFVPFTPEPDAGWLADIDVGDGTTQSPAPLTQSAEESDIPAPDGSLVHDVLRLGKDMENIPLEHQGGKSIGHEDHRIRQRERIRQLASGHKLKDEQDEEQTYRR